MTNKQLALKLTGSWGKNRETVEREAEKLIAEHCESYANIKNKELKDKLELIWLDNYLRDRL